MGARPEPVPQVVQTPASSVSALRGEVDHIEHAIKSIRCERQLQEAQAKQVAAEPSNHWMFPRCLCGMLGHVSEWMELGGSEMDVKLQAANCKCVCELLFLLSDSYLRLGRAYIEDGQFNRALNAVKFARLTRNSPIYDFWNDFSREEKLRMLTKNLRDPKAPEFAWGMRRLPPPPKEAFFPKGASFDIYTCILAGDAYFEAQRTFDDSDVVIPHQEPGEELTMSQEVENEVNRVWKSCYGCFFFCSGRGDPLPRFVENKWEKNLSAAVDCYSKALELSYRKVDSEDSESEYTKDEDTEDELTKIAYRKMGFVCHECGRRLAESGWHAKDETDKYFRKAINAFYRGKDLPNFELALCSLIEYHRKLAEFLQTQQGPDQGRIKIMEEARVEYQEALDLCRKAKNRLNKRGDGLHCKEVDTEEAHTYLKLGMFLMREGKQEEPNRNGQISAEEAIQKAIVLYEKLNCKPEVAHSQFQLDCILRERSLFESDKSDVTVDRKRADKYLKKGILLMRKDKFYYDNQEKPIWKGRTSVDEAIHKAIGLYEKLDCKPEVAYSRFQLGCVLRDRLLFESLSRDVSDRLEEKLSDIWLKPSKYYHTVGDFDMYLRIRMEHCDLYLAMRNKGLDQALIQMLEACKMVPFHGSSVSEEFIRKLLELLMTMWKATKPQPQQNIAISNILSRANNYKFMEQMCRCALKLKIEKKKDYRPLYNMWRDYATVKS